MTDAIRAKVDTAELVDIALHLARNGEAESTRMQALSWLSDRGFTRPAEKLELAHGTSDEPDEDLSMLTVEQLRALAELETQRLAILSGQQPNVLPSKTGEL